MKHRFVWLRRLVVAAQLERMIPLALPLSKRLRAWRKGFLSTSWLYYRLHERDARQYLPDLTDLDYALHHRHRLAINDKLLFSYLMQSLGFLHPRVVAFVQQGKVFGYSATAGSLAPRAWLETALTDERRVVFRPVGGGAGKGVFFLGRSEGQLEVNGTRQRQEVVCAHISNLDQYVVTEFVQQADYSAVIFPKTPNTVRVLTLWDYEVGAPFIAAAAHRFGRSTSGHTDHMHYVDAGLTANLDIDSGRLGPGLLLTSSAELQSYARHPDTGAAIEGSIVSHWEETKRQLLETAAAVPQAPLVGWDILISENGPYWLEANVPPGIDIWQIHSPFLTDPRTRAFFEAHDML